MNYVPRAMAWSHAFQIVGERVKAVGSESLGRSSFQVTDDSSNILRVRPDYQVDMLRQIGASKYGIVGFFDCNGESFCDGERLLAGECHFGKR